jgi:hypothetical protein
MLYIHLSNCVSPQQTFGSVDLETLRPSTDNQLFVLEPPYPNIPPGLLRRMGKAVKISIGAALPLLGDLPAPEGIILGTGNGGLEDCIKFLDQIIQYDEGMLTPANFVQSTANAMASQISLLSHNHGYNTSHVHRGLAFEQALLDAMMLTAETPSKTFLLGGADEISSYNNHIETLAGSFKAETISNAVLYTCDSPGSLAGEGAAFFRVSGLPGPVAVAALATLHTRDIQKVHTRLATFLEEHLPQGADLFLTGENGDNRLHDLYASLETLAGSGIARFKHMSGEHPTASAIGVWLGAHILRTGNLPAHMVKRPVAAPPKNVLLYNSYKGLQHSFILLTLPA